MLGIELILSLAITTRLLAPIDIQSNIRTPWFNHYIANTTQPIFGTLCADIDPLASLQGCVMLVHAGMDDIFFLEETFEQIEAFEARGAAGILVFENFHLVPGYALRLIFISLPFPGSS
jgi:hypothetical protein